MNRRTRVKSAWFRAAAAAGVAVVLMGAGKPPGPVPSHTGPVINRAGAGTAQRLDPAQDLFLQAFKAQQAGRAAAAIASYEAGLHLKPDFTAARFNLALLYAQTHRDDLAVHQFETILHSSGPLQPHLKAAAQLRLGLLYERMGNPAGAGEQFQAVLRLEPRNTEALGELAALAAGRGDSAGAIQYLEAYRRISPGNALVRYNLGALYARQNRLVDALHEFQASVSLPDKLPIPQEKAALVNIGVLEDRLPGHLPSAVAAYSRAIQGDPRNPAVWMARAIDEQKLKLMNAALRDYGQVIRLRPKSVPARFNSGVVLLEQKRYTDAAAEFETVLQLDPHNAAARGNLGYAYVSMPEPARSHQIARARALFQGGEKDDPRNPSNYAGLAFLDEVSGDLSGAAAQYEKLLKLKPGDPDVLDRLSSLYARTRKWDEAIRAARQSADLHPEKAEGWLALASLQIAADRKADAVATLRYYLTTQPSNIPARIKLAGLLAASPDTAAEARMEYDTVLKQQPGNTEALQGAADLLEKKQPEEAIGYAEKLLAQSSGSQWFLAGTQLVRLYQQAKPPRDPAPLYQQMIDQASKPNGAPGAASMRVYLPFLYQSLAEIYKKAGPTHYADALRTYEQGVKAVPNAPALLEGAAEMSELQKAPDKALEYYQRAMNLQPGNPVYITAFLRLGAQQKGQPEMEKEAGDFLTAHLQEKDADRILESFQMAASGVITPAWVEGLYQKLLAAHPGSAVLTKALASTYANSGKWKEALGLYTGLAASHPRDADILERKGDMEERLGQQDAALADFRTAAQIDPRTPQYQAAVLRALGRRPGTERERMQILQSLVDLDPADTSSAIQLSRLYTGPGAAQSRITLFRKLLQKMVLGPIAALYHTQLGHALEDSGDKAGARLEYLAALRINPHDYEASMALQKLEPAAPKPPLPGTPKLLPPNPEPSKPEPAAPAKPAPVPGGK